MDATNRTVRAGLLVRAGWVGPIALAVGIAMVTSACTGGSPKPKASATTTSVVASAVPASAVATAPTSAAATTTAPTTPSTGVVATTASNPSTDELAVQILELPQQTPVNVNLFSSKMQMFGVTLKVGAYPDGSSMAPAGLPEATEADTRAQLQQYLSAQIPGDADAASKALGSFDSPAVRSLVPDPTLRAALVGMTGTSFEPAIDALLTGNVFTSVAFGEPSPTTVIAQSQLDPVAGNGKHKIVFNSRYQNEKFQLLIGIMGHEIQHDDLRAPGGEEAFMAEETGIVYLEVLARNPSLAHLNTELTRRMNDFAMAVLNSKHPHSAQNVVVAQDGLGLYPRSSSDNNPDVWNENLGAGSSPLSSPASPVILRSLLAPGTPIPTNFDRAGAAAFEHLADPKLPPVTRVRLSVLLGLVSVDTVAQQSGLSKDQAIQTLGLQPFATAS